MLKEFDELFKKSSKLQKKESFAKKHSKKYLGKNSLTLGDEPFDEPFNVPEDMQILRPKRQGIGKSGEEVDERRVRNNYDQVQGKAEANKSMAKQDINKITSNYSSGSSG